MQKILFSAVLLILIFSCSKDDSKESLLLNGGFVIKNFDPIINSESDDIVSYTVDLDNALEQGIIVPTENGQKTYFKFQFEIKNSSGKDEKFYYKIYYQNESYGFNLFYADQNKAIPNARANNNFYGSWENQTGFHSTELIESDNKFHVVQDSFCIQGNPRNEQKYFGGDFFTSEVTEEDIQKKIEHITGTPEWVEQIKNKAKDNNITYEKQLRLDAVYAAEMKNKSGNKNNRWKRNPRMGNYNFLLVVVRESNLEKIPSHFQDVTKMDTTIQAYQNPYHYFLGQRTENIPIFKKIIAEKKLNVKIKYDLKSGIYLGKADQDKSKLYHSQFEQYFHSTDHKFHFNNIPLAADVSKDSYNLENYTENSEKFSENQLVKDFIKSSLNPGKTVFYDPNENAILMVNPGKNSSRKMTKENAGLQTRHGLTYGRFIAKIKFPEIINDHFIWNGLTCAYWLKYQDGDWNNRSICNTGYVPKLFSDSSKVKSTVYSEIDIEIVKTSKYWPKSSYGDMKDYPKDDGLNPNIMLTTTNWDLACEDPKDYAWGIKEILYNNQTFASHRWDRPTKFTTTKFEYPQDKVLGKECYYVIEWYPDHIEWKVGPTKDSLITIGYLHENNSSIPDNQMHMVFTQEYHLSKWWPTAPFKQELIPYPLNDIKGYIYEVEIE